MDSGWYVAWCDCVSCRRNVLAFSQHSKVKKIIQLSWPVSLHCITQIMKHVSVLVPTCHTNVSVYMIFFILLLRRKIVVPHQQFFSLYFSFHQFILLSKSCAFGMWCKVLLVKLGKSVSLCRLLNLSSSLILSKVLKIFLSSTTIIIIVTVIVISEKQCTLKTKGLA